MIGYNIPNRDEERVRILNYVKFEEWLDKGVRIDG